MGQSVHFITGAGSGLGLLTAQRALSEGWSVAALDVNTAGLDSLGESPRLLKLTVDITDVDALETAVAQCEDTLGPIERLTNAAAIMPLGLLEDQPRELILKVMTINYGGLVNLTATAFRRMRERGRGTFVSYASMAGHWPLIYMGAYNASKHAVASFTEVLHHEARGSGVRVICVCPPIVATPLLDQAKATTWPKIFNIFPAIEPNLVIDTVEKAVSRNRLWVFPGPITRISWWMRRWMPGLLWWTAHRVEKV